MQGRGAVATFQRGMAAAILLALPLLAAQAAAQEPLPAHDVRVVEASMNLYQLPAVEAMVQRYEGKCIGGDSLTIDARERNVTFEDPLLETQCGEAQIALPVPPGSTSLVVGFVASRQIVQQGLFETQFSMQQELRLYGPDGVIANESYYDDQEGVSPPTPFEFEFALPEGLSQVRLGWYFADNGARFRDEVVVEQGQSFEASVTNMTVRWPSVPFAAPVVHAGPEEEHEGDGVAVAHVTVNLTVSRATLLSGNRASLLLAIASGPELTAVRGPQGQVAAGEVDRSEVLNRQEFSVPDGIVAAQGPGTYSFDFLSVRALAPVPPPPLPSRSYPVYLAVLLLPIPAAVLATHSANAYRREAEGPYVRTARIVLALIVAIVVYYVLIALYSLIEVGPRAMAVLPPSNLTLLVYSQLLLVLILLVGIAILQARSRTGAMRRDIEERRRKEDRLRRSNEELERFAYVASHDLQEPLRKVAGFTALLQKRYAGRLDRDADEIIQYAVDGASRMQMLIKDILAYSRVGSKELERVPVDANETMAQVAADLDGPVRETGAEVRWKELPTVRADASQLRQVLQNLVENAIKYRHPKRRPRVAVSADLDGDAWHFQVKDNGQGIPRDKHEEIFGIFRRLHGQGTPGTGIGLAVAKKAVERHEGRIWVESVMGRGSTFHFTLPRSRLDGSGPWVPSPQQKGAGAAPAA